MEKKFVRILTELDKKKVKLDKVDLNEHVHHQLTTE